jgi:hypothetical protein
LSTSLGARRLQFYINCLEICHLEEVILWLSKRRAFQAGRIASPKVGMYKWDGMGVGKAEDRVQGIPRNYIV